MDVNKMAGQRQLVFSPPAEVICLCIILNNLVFQIIMIEDSRAIVPVLKSVLLLNKLLSNSLFQSS